MDYPPGDTTNMVIRPGDGDLHGNKVPLPWGVVFFGPEVTSKTRDGRDFSDLSGANQRV